MTSSAARMFLVEQLTPRYGPGEAASIARIVIEDAFPKQSPLTDGEQLRLGGILHRLLAGEPVQYVLGQADFFGLKFKVNPAVLIPRQETEELVAWVLEDLKNRQLENPSVLDVGLGSGCIGISLKKKFPRLRLFGLEKSPDALAVAVENARLILGDDDGFEFVEGDILNPLDWKRFSSFDILVSNPPYIPLIEKSWMPDHVVAHEPALALFVENDDPLLFYRVIADVASQKLRPGGTLYFECNEFNAKEVVTLLRDKRFAEVTLKKDLAGADRMLRSIFWPS